MAAHNSMINIPKVQHYFKAVAKSFGCTFYKLQSDTICLFEAADSTNILNVHQDKSRVPS